MRENFSIMKRKKLNFEEIDKKIQKRILEETLLSENFRNLSNAQKIEEIFKIYKLSKNYLDDYDNAIELIRRINYSSQDITEFSKALFKYQNEWNFEEKSGIFLSALINNCIDDEITIVTKNIDKKLKLVGFKNEKNFVVDGDVGDSLGLGMSGGSIVINGNAGDYIGWYMKDGCIFINGNAGKAIGFEMSGGSIYIRGKYISISSNIKNGKIYVKNNLVFL